MSNVTANMLIYATREDIRSYSDDSSIDDRTIIFEWNNQRALLLKRSLDINSRIINDDLIQDLGCVELIAASKEECCDFSSECKIMRTNKKIPAMIALHGSVGGMTRVGSIDKHYRNYSVVTYEKAMYSGKGRASKFAIYAYRMNDYVYLISGNPMMYRQKYINIRGLIADPELASTFNTCDSDPCYTRDSPYPITADMIPIIQELVKQRILSRYMAPTDTSNNSNDDTDSATVKQ